MPEEFIEECWFIYGIRLGSFFVGFKKYHSKGTSGSVEFSWEQAMNPFLIGWIHTHGPFGLEPSEKDNSTMRSWVRGKAKPMICGIYSGRKKAWYNYFRPGLHYRNFSIYRSKMRVFDFGIMLGKNINKDCTIQNGLEFEYGDS